MPVDDTCNNIKMITLNMLPNAIKECHSKMSNYPDLQMYVMAFLLDINVFQIK